VTAADPPGGHFGDAASWAAGWRRQSTASAAIYGLVVSAAVMAAAGEHGTVFDVVTSVVVTVLIYWIAEAFSEVLGQQVATAEPMGRGATLVLLRQRWALVEASYAPLVVVVAVRVLGGSTDAAINAGLLTATVMLAGFGWVAASRRGSAGFMRVATALLSASFGVVMIALKALLH